MDEKPSDPNAPSDIRVLIGTINFFLIVILPLMLFTDAVYVVFQIGVFFGGPVIGAYVIWGIVRLFNRRDDPRHVRRPPD